MAQVRPLYLPPPYQDSAESGRLILRDGTTAIIRVAQPQDRLALQAFFKRLSPQSRYRRFFTSSCPREEITDALCDSPDPHSRLTLIVLRTPGGTPRIIATGSYIAKDEKTAEVAIAVEDPFQGEGCKIADCRIWVERPSRGHPDRKGPPGTGEVAHTTHVRSIPREKGS